MKLIVAHEGPQVELVRRSLELLDLGLLLFILLQLFLVTALLFLYVKAVISGIKLRLAVFQLNDPIDHLVQEVPVVRDGENGAFEPGQILLQPFRGPEIQMVGGLVQQEHVGVLQNKTAQVHTGLFPAGEVGKLPLPHFSRNIQAVADLIEGGLGVVPAAGLEGGRKGVIPLEERGLILPLLHTPCKEGHLPLQLLQPVKGAAEHPIHRISHRIYRYLGDEAHPLPGGRGHLPLVRLQFPGEDTEQRGLARSVFSQQADPLPSVHLKGQSVQDPVAHLKLFTDV